MLEDVDDKNSNFDTPSILPEYHSPSEPTGTITQKRIESRLKKHDDYVICYTDGASSRNGTKLAKAGIGCYFPKYPFLNISERLDINTYSSGKTQTNNTAEVEAIFRAIQQAYLHNHKKLIIYTDSMYSINCLTKWCKK